MQGSSVIRCIDAAGLGTEVFQLAIPEGWVFFGGMEWSSDPSFAVHGTFAVASPDGRCAVEFFPDHASAWTDDETARRSMPATSFVRVAPPPAPAGALMEWVVQRYRQGVQPVEFLIEEDMKIPEIPTIPRGVQDAGGFSLPAMPRMGRVRVRYSLGGTPMEEEFWGQLAVNQVPPSLGMPFPYTYAVLNMTISYRAPAGELDANLNTLFGIQGSYRPNQEYFEQLRRLFQPDPAAAQGGQDPARAQAALAQHQMTVMRMINEYSNRWTTLILAAGQGAGEPTTPLSSAAALLGYPPEGRLLGTVAAPAPASPVTTPAAPPSPTFVPGPPGGQAAPPPPAPGGFCPACGARSQPGANFCMACGTRLAPPATPPPPPPMPQQGAPPPRHGFQGQPAPGREPGELPIICPHCKAPMPPGSPACRYCGSPL